ncbi:MAG TPA: DHA2 family efflux MFS transporter permease subunit [Solirubrobacteraceae bacterium]
MTDILSSRRRTEVLALMCAALAVVTAAFISLNVALPSFARDTGATQTQLTWIVGAYGLVFAALLLPAGALADRIGRREVLVGGLGVFTLASLAIAFVSEPGAVIALRVVSAVGAAAVMPSTLSILISIFPAAERGRAVGAWAATAGGAGILALLASGGLLEVFSWQSIFVLNAALGAPLLVAIARRVPTSRDPNPGPVDPVGVLLSVLGLGAIVFGVVEGPERGWDSPLVLGVLVGGFVALVGFVLWELRTAHPLLDPRLFRSPSFAAGSFAITMQFFAIFAFQFVSLQYLQQVLGYSALRAGLALLPIGVILGVVAPRAPQLAARFGMRAVVATGSGLLAAGLLILAQSQVDSGYGLYLAGILVLGAGMALSAAPATEAILGGLPPSQQGLASAVNDTTRELGGALGIAILGSLLNLGYRGTIDDRLADEQVRAAARPSLQAATQTAQGLGDRGGQVLDVAQGAFVHGLHIAFYSGAAAVVLGTACFLLLAPRHQPQPSSLSAVELDAAPV